ncbi:hypothetical protein QYF61_000858 [Mycteria americana]|uniref:Uncharacterized protein n=1 Tax=Mycteria americana TaxID=33587 RepID=A0AAN7PUV8_MYCAM|nr:hypothetical protein QYF61_000858 [Mycteria americana]
MGGVKCPVGVVTAMEAEQLAAQRQTSWAATYAAHVENLVVKVHHVDAHVPNSRATEEHQNNQQVDQAAKIEVAQVGLDWQHKGELFIAWWAHDSSVHQGRDAADTWARDRGVDLTMDTVAQVHKKLGGGTEKTVDPNWPKGYSIPYDIMPSV